MMEFRSWPKTPRLLKNMVITEKIDGTNACVVIEEAPEGYHMGSPIPEDVIDLVAFEGKVYFIGAQSRNRMILPGKRDNAGFAAWVDENAYQLFYTLGPGYHYGEWFGYKIGRTYGLELGDRRFALFNSSRWGFLSDPNAAPNIPGLVVVPVLYQGTFNTEDIEDVFAELMVDGSSAVPGFMKPEGIIIYHSASGQVYKMTDNGDVHKGLVS